MGGRPNTVFVLSLVDTRCRPQVQYFCDCNVGESDTSSIHAAASELPAFPIDVNIARGAPRMWSLDTDWLSFTHLTRDEIALVAIANNEIWTLRSLVHDAADGTYLLQYHIIVAGGEFLLEVVALENNFPASRGRPHRFLVIV